MLWDVTTYMYTQLVFFSVRIKCRDLVKKIAIYRNRLAVSAFVYLCVCVLVHVCLGVLGF
jgi:hypothetical protein